MGPILPVRIFSLFFTFGFSILSLCADACSITFKRHYNFFRLLTYMYILGSHVSCGLWSLVELHVGVVCACMPSMKPLFAKWLGFVQTQKESHLSSKIVKSS